MSSKSLILVFILYVSQSYACQIEQENVAVGPHPHPQYNHWDILMFVQRWPISVCKLHKRKQHDAECAFPKNKDMWTIHGLWPTRLGTKFPKVCNDSWPFEPEMLKPIENDLREDWTNILVGKGPAMKFYSHEWDVHGTCATNVTQLDSIIKYFNATINLHTQFVIHDILSASNILPDNKKELTIEELNNAVIAKTGKRPVSSCDFLEGTQYLEEMMICFDKNLKLIDCDGFITVHGVLTECDISQGIVYPSKL